VNAIGGVMAGNTRIRFILAVILALLVGGIAGSWTTVKAKWSPFGRVEAVPILLSSAESSQVGKEVSFANGFVSVAQKVLPSVVNIASSKIVRSAALGPSAPFLSDPFFQRFFGREFSDQLRAPQERREHSLGSGVVISSDGYILTNNHVVSGASEVKISLPDQREVNAFIVGTDPKTDIAVLRIDNKNLSALTLGDSSKMRVGDFAVAVGNPFGVGQTMTMGIVSATGRGGFGIEDYEDFIQTDAAVNPGNSGGALVNVNGELIGINTAIVSGGGGSQGVGFAVPINMARNIMDQILKTGKVTRGYLGLTAQPVTEAIAKVWGLSGTPHGALISDVVPDSPAARAGLARGDIILEMNGNPIADSRALGLKTSALAPGTRVTLKISRDGKPRDVPVTLGELPPAKSTDDQNAPANETGTPRLGISVEPMTPQVARQLNLAQTTTGIVVTDVQPGSAAEEAGVQRGDVIQEINRKSISGIDEFQNAVRQTGSQPILLLVDRGGSHLFIAVEPRGSVR
jgi:serine protease Do